jgi:hypothetical protein
MKSRSASNINKINAWLILAFVWVSGNVLHIPENFLSKQPPYYHTYH